MGEMYPGFSSMSAHSSAKSLRFKTVCLPRHQESHPGKVWLPRGWLAGKFISMVHKVWTGSSQTRKCGASGKQRKGLGSQTHLLSKRCSATVSLWGTRHLLWMQILSTQVQLGAQAQLGLQGVECGGEVAWKPVKVFTSYLFPEAPHLYACPSLPPACVCCPWKPAAAAGAHSSLAMMEKGSTGLLASSCRAVRKQSAAASFRPWSCSTSPRPCHASW